LDGVRDLIIENEGKTFQLNYSNARLAPLLKERGWGEVDE
jgi:hypothetical protein